MNSAPMTCTNHAYRAWPPYDMRCLKCGVFKADVDAARHAKPAERGDAVSQENDGCPTEKAVLQRFWREHHQTARSATDSVAPAANPAPSEDAKDD